MRLGPRLPQVAGGMDGGAARHHLRVPAGEEDDDRRRRRAPRPARPSATAVIGRGPTTQSATATARLIDDPELDRGVDADPRERAGTRPAPCRRWRRACCPRTGARCPLPPARRWSPRPSTAHGKLAPIRSVGRSSEQALTNSCQNSAPPIEVDPSSTRNTSGSRSKTSSTSALANPMPAWISREGGRRRPGASPIARSRARRRRRCRSGTRRASPRRRRSSCR